MTRRIVVTAEANQDLREIAIYLGQHSKPAAFKFLKRVRSLFRSLTKHGFMGRARPEWGEDLRSMPIGDYVVIYMVDGRDVVIIRIYHGARDLDRIFSS